MTNKLSIHCYISGKVQGVWYRASTQKQAQQWQLTGWARNLPDGRVEVLACGERADLARLHAWLKQGPALAEVTEVTYEELPWQDIPDFSTD